MDLSHEPAVNKLQRTEFVCFYCDCTKISKGRLLSHIRHDHPGERIAWRQSAGLVRGRGRCSMKLTEKGVKFGTGKRGRPFKQPSLRGTRPCERQPRVEKSAEFWTRFSDWYESDGEGKRYLPWLEEEKAAVVRYFGRYIQSGTVPMCEDIDAVRQRDQVLSGRTYLQIWSFIRSQSTAGRGKDGTHEVLTYACSDCCYSTTSRFHFSLHLALHARQHDNLHPVKSSKLHPRCGICGYFAASPEDFESHVTQHSFEKSFLCCSCWRDFDQVAKLLAHCRHQHPDQGVSKFLERGALYRQLAKDVQLSVSLDPVVRLSRSECRGDGGLLQWGTGIKIRDSPGSLPNSKSGKKPGPSKGEISVDAGEVFQMEQKTLQENIFMNGAKPRYYRKVDLSGNVSIRSVKEVELSDVTIISEEVTLKNVLIKPDVKNELPDISTSSDGENDLPDLSTRSDEENHQPELSSTIDEDVDFTDHSSTSNDNARLHDLTLSEKEESQSDLELDREKIPIWTNKNIQKTDISARSVKDVRLSDISFISHTKGDISDTSAWPYDDERNSYISITQDESLYSPTISNQDVDISDISARSDEDDSGISTIADKDVSEIPTCSDRKLDISNIIQTKLKREVGLSCCLQTISHRQADLTNCDEKRLDRNVSIRSGVKESCLTYVPPGLEQRVCLCHYLPYATSVQKCRYKNCSSLEDEMYLEETFHQSNEMKAEKLSSETKIFWEVTAEKRLKLGDVLADALKKVKQEKYKTCY